MAVIGLESIFKLSLIMNMVDNLTGPLSSVTSSVDNSTSRIQNMNQTFGDMTKTGLAISGVGTQITGAVLAPVEATFDTKKALGELSSLGVEDLEALESAARSFSDTWAGTTKADFITAAYDIKSGISSLTDEGIAGYTEIAGITAKATKASIEEMTSLFASGYGIYKGYYDDLSDFEFAEMFSAGIAESVRAFKTSGSGMANAIQSLGASATNASVPLEEQLAVLGMLQATMGGSEAGTKYNAFLRSAAKGGKALGLEFTDANDQLKGLPEILDLIRGKYGDTIDAAEKMELQKAFGDALSVQFIDLFYNKTEDLQDNILGLYGTMGDGIDVATRMADAINSTEPDQYLLLQQQMQNIKEVAGTSILPTINNIMARGSELMNRVGAWAEQNQDLVGKIMLIALVIGGVLTVVGGAIAVIGGVGLIFTKSVGMVGQFIGVVKKIAMVMPGLISSFWGFASALLANPITWIVVGIVALIAIIIVLYNKCEWFRDAVNAVWGSIKDTVSAVFGFIQELFGDMKAAYEEYGGGLSGIAAAIMTGLSGIYEAGFNWLDNLTGGKLSDMKATYEAHGGGLRGAAAVAWEGVKGAASAGLNLLDRVTGGKLTEIQNTYQEHGGGLKGVAAVAMTGIRDRYEQGFTALDTLTGGKLTALKDKFTDRFGSIEDIVASSMQGAKDFAATTLFDMQAAYESHGGGIQGAAAAAWTGIRSIAEGEFSLLDKLTGGRLSSIRDTVSDGVQRIKDAITDKFQEFKDSGRKLIETFTDGIKSAISAPVDAVKGGLAKVREMLPFSDAKTGPLSTLTLSGTRTMSTLAEGMQRGSDLPAQATVGGLEKVQSAIQAVPGADLQDAVINGAALTTEPADISSTREAPRQVDVREIIRETIQERTETETTTTEKQGGVHIENFSMPVDLKKIRDLALFLNVLRELEDFFNANGLAIDGSEV